MEREIIIPTGAHEKAAVFYALEGIFAKKLG